MSPKIGTTSNRDIQMVMQEHFNPTDLSVNAQLSRLKGSSSDS